MPDDAAPPGGYREPLPPPPQIFDLSLGQGARASLFVSALALLLALGICVLTRGRVLLLFAVLPPALFYLFGSAPHRLEVHYDRVVVRYRFRRAYIFDPSRLIVQRLPDALVLVEGATTCAIPASRFPDRGFEDALRALEDAHVHGSR